MNVGQASVVSQMSITDLPLPPSSLLLLPCFSYSLKSLTPQLSSVTSSLQELCPNLSNCQLLGLVSFPFILSPIQLSSPWPRPRAVAPAAVPAPKECPQRALISPVLPVSGDHLHLLPEALCSPVSSRFHGSACQFLLPLSLTQCPPPPPPPSSLGPSICSCLLPEPWAGRYPDSCTGTRQCSLTASKHSRGLGDVGLVV